MYPKKRFPNTPLENGEWFFLILSDSNDKINLCVQVNKQLTFPMQSIKFTNTHPQNQNNPLKKEIDKDPNPISPPHARQRDKEEQHEESKHKVPTFGGCSGNDRTVSIVHVGRFSTLLLWLNTGTHR